MKNIQNGLLAGLFAGLVLAVLFFIDYGPGGLLHNPARWLALDSKDAGKYAGFLLLIILGGIFGVLFSLIERRGERTLGRSLLLGVATGVLFWIIIPFLFGTLINHGRLDFSGFLYSFVPLLLYGMLLGSFSYQREVRAEHVQAGRGMI